MVGFGRGLAEGLLLTTSTPLLLSAVNFETQVTTVSNASQQEKSLCVFAPSPSSYSKKHLSGFYFLGASACGGVSGAH